MRGIVRLFVRESTDCPGSGCTSATFYGAGHILLVSPGRVAVRPCRRDPLFGRPSERPAVDRAALLFVAGCGRWIRAGSWLGPVGRLRQALVRRHCGGRAGPGSFSGAGGSGAVWNPLRSANQCIRWYESAVLEGAARIIVWVRGRREVPAWSTPAGMTRGPAGSMCSTASEAGLRLCAGVPRVAVQACRGPHQPALPGQPRGRASPLAALRSGRAGDRRHRSGVMGRREWEKVLAAVNSAVPGPAVEAH